MMPAQFHSQLGARGFPGTTSLPDDGMLDRLGEGEVHLGVREDARQEKENHHGFCLVPTKQEPLKSIRLNDEQETPIDYSNSRSVLSAPDELIKGIMSKFRLREKQHDKDKKHEVYEHEKPMEVVDLSIGAQRETTLERCYVKLNDELKVQEPPKKRNLSAPNELIKGIVSKFGGKKNDIEPRPVQAVHGRRQAGASRPIHRRPEADGPREVPCQVERRAEAAGTPQEKELVGPQ